MGGFDDGIRLGNLISILPYSGQYWVPSAWICQPHFVCNLCMIRNINRLHTHLEVIQSITNEEIKYSKLIKHINLKKSFIRCYVENKTIDLKHILTKD